MLCLLNGKALSFINIRTVLPVDSFSVTVQCHIPRHEVPLFKMENSKQWRKEWMDQEEMLHRLVIKATAGGLESHLPDKQHEDECTAPEQSSTSWKFHLSLVGHVLFTLSRVMTVQTYELLKYYFISLSYMSFHTFYCLIKPLF